MSRSLALARVRGVQQAMTQREFDRDEHRVWRAIGRIDDADDEHALVAPGGRG